MKTRIIITGARGRMGRSVQNCANEDPSFEVVASVDRNESLKAMAQEGSVVIDFSHHTATPEFAEVAAIVGCPMVIGTTGLTVAEKKIVTIASTKIPVVFAPNMSVGVNLLFALARTVTSVLNKGYDIEIIEKHHRKKKDSPSGTAIRLLEIISAEKKLNGEEVVRHGRKGDVGERTESEIGMHAIRGGDYVGEHSVIFASEGDVVEITHKASSREIFARGALRAARWVGQAKPGLYDMGDVLGLSKPVKGSIPLNG